MKPILGVVGTSFAAGYRDDYNPTLQINREDSDNAWPKLVTDILNFELVDESYSGISMSKILRKTMDMILSDRCKIILVELTRVDWYELGSSIDGKIYQIQTTSILPINKIILTEYYNTYLFYTNMLRIVVMLQSLAEKKQTPLYFIDVSANIVNPLTYDNFVEQVMIKNSALFNALDDSMITERFNITQQINKEVDYSKFLFDLPITKIMRAHGATDEYFDKTKHPTVLGQKLIARLILDSLQDKI